MFSILIIPEAYSDDQYFTIAPIQEIHPLGLLTVEDKLSELLKNIEKTMKSIKIAENNQKREFICSKALSFTFNFPMKNFNDLVEKIEGKLFDIQRNLACQISRLNEIKSTTANNTKELEKGIIKEQYMFIDCFYCSIEWKLRKKIEKLFDKNILIFVQKMEERAIYKIYCLKSETMKVKEELSKLFGKSIIILEGIPTISNNENTKLVNLEVKKIYEECIELYLFTVLMKGFSEILNKYGLPPNFKYKILKNSKISREIKRIKNISKAEEVEDLISLNELIL